MIWSNKIFDGETNWVLSDRLHEILIKNLEREKMSLKVESVASVDLPWPVDIQDWTFFENFWQFLKILT